MRKTIPYRVKLRHPGRGEEHDVQIFASDEASARKRAMVRANIALGKTMAERKYGVFEVLSCLVDGAQLGGGEIGAARIAPEKLVMVPFADGSRFRPGARNRRKSE